MQRKYFSTFDRGYAVQSQDTSRKHATYPYNYSLSQGTNPYDSTLSHQFVGYNLKHGHTYPMDHQLNPSSNSTVQQSPLHQSLESLPSTENNCYNSRSTQQLGSLANSRLATMGRDLRSLQEYQHMLDPQMQQVVASAQAQAQLNAISLGNVDRSSMGRYAQSVSVSSFPSVVSMQEPFSSNRDQDSCTAVRSTLMHEFKSNNRTNKRYELKVGLNAVEGLKHRSAANMV